MMSSWPTERTKLINEFVKSLRCSVGLGGCSCGDEPPCTACRSCDAAANGIDGEQLGSGSFCNPFVEACLPSQTFSLFPNICPLMGSVTLLFDSGMKLAIRNLLSWMTSLSLWSLMISAVVVATLF